MRHRLLAALAITAVLAGWLPQAGAQATPRIGQPSPEITGGPWINTEPLSLSRLRHRVVLVEFWTYG